MAAFALTLALCFAPVFSALTHGPGQIAMEADHAAWHAEQGEHWQTIDHDHHSDSDHDHSPSVILSSAGALEHYASTELWAPQASQPSGIIRDGPRRPPRLT